MNRLVLGDQQYDQKSSDDPADTDTKDVP